MTRPWTWSLQGAVGYHLLKSFEKRAMKRSGLKEMSIDLGERKATYLERVHPDSKSEKSLIILHGMSQQPRELASMVILIDRHDSKLHEKYRRIIIPELIGHGSDMQRVFETGEYPSSDDFVLDANMWLDYLLDSQERCDLVGNSMGGAIAYHLKLQEQQTGRDSRIDRIILLSPALRATVNPEFLADFLSGKKKHFAYETREELKILFQDLSTPNRKKDPIPQFLFEAILRLRRESVPDPKYYHNLFTRAQKSLDEKTEIPVQKNELSDLKCVKVLWPEFDYFCSLERGKKFFGDGDHFVTIPDGGHLFLSSGEPVDVCTVPLIVDFLSS